MPALPSLASISRYYLITWLGVIAHVSRFTSREQYADPFTALWTLAVTASYSMFYLLPAIAGGYLCYWLLRRSKRPRSGNLLLATTLVALPGLTHVALFADRMIHDMYGFHINGFVVDLLLTPGGIASLGATRSTELTATLIVVALLAFQALLYYWLVARGTSSSRPLPRLLRWRWVFFLILAASMGERVAYGYSSAINYQPILFASERYPMYLPMTFRKLAAKMGVGEAENPSDGMHVKSSVLSYPLKPLDIDGSVRPPNIVWLVAESLRFDMLDPKIMPQLWDFSQQALRLEQHYSGGNLTQMGVFSMFYGLYGNYWFPMHSARRSPVLMDVMQQRGYQFSLHTSQRFTFPAFDKTIFVGMNPADMHALSGGPPAWQRDQENIKNMLGYIDKRDETKPFMTYMFFESTHAAYDFPPESVIAKPYLEDLNYLTTDFKGDIQLIKNRYLNASHHVDQQIGRVIEHLKQKKLLDNTVVIVLGDHGEEFMERSRWGHSAEFNRFQTSTPAVIWAPGNKARVVTGISSHLDIPATLMPLLGVRNPPSDYSQGMNLLDPAYHREYAVAADWNRLAYLGEKIKIAFPINATGGAKRDEVTDGNDHPIADPAQAKRDISPAIAEMMQNLRRFSRPKDLAAQTLPPVRQGDVASNRVQ
jgi:membrane-anchored protein YejM (alkaline phosphatase superfamily)